MGSTRESSGTSYSGNEVRRTGLAGVGDDIPTEGDVCDEFNCGGAAPSGISPCLSSTNDSEENV